MSSSLFSNVLLQSALAGLCCMPPSTTPVVGKVFLTVDEALELAFPECQVERGTAYLKKESKERVAKLAGTDFETGILHPYVAKREGKLVGTAYFDTHVVRSLRETLMFVVAPDDTIARVEVLAFGEPLDYLPRTKWFGQFAGRALDDELNLQRGIRNVTGATLSARATTRAAREVLAGHRVLREIAAEKERERKKKEKKKKKGDGDAPPEPGSRKGAGRDTRGET